jgi:hypothetical protein
MDDATRRPPDVRRRQLTAHKSMVSDVRELEAARWAGTLDARGQVHLKAIERAVARAENRLWGSLNRELG